MRKKIGFLIYDASLMGGAEKISIDIANELSNYYDVYIFSVFNENIVKHNIISDKVIYEVLEEKTISITFNLFKISKQLKHYLKKYDIDQLYSITAGVNTIALISTKGLDVRTIYCEHSNLSNQSYGKKHFFRQKLGAKYMDKIITLTERDRLNFISTFSLNSEKVLKIYNWYDKPDNFIDEGYDSNSKSIITVGRFAKVKGFDTLIEVAKKVFEKHNDWTWEIYGDGELFDTIKKSIESLGLERNVILKGKSNDMMNHYKRHAFYVLTSRYEGLPISLLEAKINHLPIISFDCETGPSEVISNGINGYLVCNQDVEEMENKIDDLINNKCLRIKFSQKSESNISEFKKEYILKEWLNLVDSL